jgi:NADPH:quinone reductase-like Zn-dependent oxidoreductase
MFALKLAYSVGFRIILSSSSDQKLEGMSNRFTHPPIRTINYATKPDWHEEVLKYTNGNGVDLVVENGGTPSLVQSLKCTRRGGTISQVGYLGKQDPNYLSELLPLLIDRRVNLR